MAAAFGERQRAEEFARLLDSLDDGPHAGVATLDRGDGGGAAVDGTSVNGAPASGAPVNGTSINGVPTNGTPVNGAHRDRSRDTDGWEDFADGGARESRPEPTALSIPAQRVGDHGHGRTPDPEMAAMLRAVESLIAEASFSPVHVRPAFKEELGRRLQEDFLLLYNADVDHHDDGDAELAARPRGGSAWRRRLLGGTVAVGVLSGGIGGVAWAASSALPGDPLYGVKRGLENMRVSVSGSDLERGEQYLGQAKTRLTEVRRLLAHHDANVDGSDVSGLIGTTMDSLYGDMDNAGQLLVPLADQGNTEALANLRTFLAAYEPQVHDLEILLAPDSQSKASRLLTLMQSLDTRAAAAQAAIDRARNSQQHPGAASSSTSHRSDAAPSTAPSGAVSSPGPPRSGSAPSAGVALTPAPPTSTGPLDVQVPIGSPSTTVVVPPLLSGLPPIGITLGNPAPATGPTTDAGPPATDPNPN